MSGDLDVIEGQVELLKGEILEYRLYIEICAITILFIIILFFGSSTSVNQLKTNFLGHLIISSVVIILGLMIYMFSRVVYISKFSIKSTLKDKKLLLEDWLK
jgi:hypothetical protein